MHLGTLKNDFFLHTKSNAINLHVGYVLTLALERLMHVATSCAGDTRGCR